MLVLKQLVIFALVITLAYAKKGKGGDRNDEWDHLIHYNDANEGPQDQATQYVPEQEGIEFFMKLYHRLDISLFKNSRMQGSEMKARESKYHNHVSRIYMKKDKSK